MKIQSGSSATLPRSVGLTTVLKSEEVPDNLQSLVSSGVIAGYEQRGNEVFIQSSDPQLASVHKALPPRAQTFQPKGWQQKLQNFLLPTDHKQTCAPEYVSFRAWQLGGALVSGVIGFMTTQVYLDSMRVAFSTTEQAAMSGVITGTIQKATQMGGFALAKQGDSNPKKAFLTSSLIASANAIAGLGLLAVLPQAHLPFYCATAVTGTVAGLIGGAAGINIANHLAPGSNKGEVGAKNGNQDMVASCFGMPLGVGLSRLAKSVGLNPAVLAACTLGPVLAFCSIQAARCLKMEAVNRSQLQEIADHYLASGQIDQVSKGGLLSTLFQTDGPVSENIEFVASLTPVLGGDAEAQYARYAGRKYMLGLSPQGKVQIAVRSDAQLGDVVQAYAQARLVEKKVDQANPEGFKELLDLSARATATLPDMVGSGWHNHLGQLRIPTVQAFWSETAPTRGPLTVDQFLAL